MPPWLNALPTCHSSAKPLQCLNVKRRQRLRNMAIQRDFADFSRPDSTPTTAEIRVIEGTKTGSVAVCKDLDEAESTISASLIEALATDRFHHSHWPDWSLHRNGLRVSNALFREQINLENCRVPIPLVFLDCRFSKVLDLDRMQIEGNLFVRNCDVIGECRMMSAEITGQFSANNTRFTNSDGNAILAQGVKALAWFMDNAVLQGKFDINSAEIAGQFAADNAKFTNRNGEAIQAHSVKATAWFMRNSQITGELNISGCNFTGTFSANNSTFINDGGPAMFAPHIKAAGWFMNEATIRCSFTINGSAINGDFLASRFSFTNINGVAIYAAGTRSNNWILTDSLINGELNISDSYISGRFIAKNSTFHNKNGDAIYAESARATRWLMRGADVQGRFSINSAEITGRFSGNNARFENLGGDAIWAQGVKAAGWFMNEAKVRGRFSIVGAEIGGHFEASRASFVNAGSVAIYAHSIKSNIFVMIDSRIEGEFNIRDSYISGRFIANNSKFHNENGNAIHAESARATRWLMRGVDVQGRFSINSAEITGQFSANNARFENSGGDAIWAQGIKAAGWFMNEAEVRGRLAINSARITGRFSAESAIFRNPGKNAIQADRIKANGFILNNTIINGSIFINECELLSSFTAEMARFYNEKSDAILARYSLFRNGVLLRKSTIVCGGVDLSYSRVEKSLDFTNSRLEASRYRSVMLQAATVIGETNFSGANIFGHVFVSRAEFNGRVIFKGAQIVAGKIARRDGELPPKLGKVNDKIDEERQNRFCHHALVLQEARINGRLVLPEDCPEGIVDLSHAQCATLEDHASGWAAPLARKTEVCDTRLCFEDRDGNQNEIQHIVLDGFKYSHFEFPAGVEDRLSDQSHQAEQIAAERIKWLTGQSARDLFHHFNPQPWRQATMVLREMGYDRAAQILSIERRVRERQARDTSQFERSVSWLLGFAASYGFSPWRTVVMCVAVVFIWGGVFWGGHAHCNGRGISSDTYWGCNGQPAFAPIRYGDVQPQSALDRKYPSFGALEYSIDIFVPLVSFNSESFWRANTDSLIGGFLYWFSILERLLGAILIAIAVVGFTGLLTRDEM